MYRYRFAGYGIRNSLGDTAGFATNKERAKAFCRENNLLEENIFMLYECEKAQ
jgi:hypothetical protein